MIKDLEWAKYIKPKESNFTWEFGENIQFNFAVKRTLFNRFKWWLGTKICIPGSYKWEKLE